MKRIQNETELYDLNSSSTGYIYNDFGFVQQWDEKQGDKLHKAGCGYVKKMTVNNDKYFFKTYKDAKNWLDKNRPDLYTECPCVTK